MPVPPQPPSLATFFEPVLETLDTDVFMRRWCTDDCDGLDEALSSIECWRPVLARPAFLAFFFFSLNLLPLLKEKMAYLDLGRLLLVNNFIWGV